MAGGEGEGGGGVKTLLRVWQWVLVVNTKADVFLFSFFLRSANADSAEKPASNSG